QSSSDISPADPGMATPALLNITSRRPWRSTASWTKASTSWEDRTSVPRKKAWPPAPRISSAARSPPAASMSPRPTRAPSAASALAAARPMPDAAPVTSATFPSTRPISFPPEPRFPLLHERGDALRRVRRPVQPEQRLVLRGQPLFQRHLEGRSNQLEHLPRRQRRHLGHRFGPGHGGVHAVLALDHP